MNSWGYKTTKLTNISTRILEVKLSGPDKDSILQLSGGQSVSLNGNVAVSVALDRKRDLRIDRQT